MSSAGIRCDNGVIHVLDRVIMPELRDLATVAEEAGTFKNPGCSRQGSRIARSPDRRFRVDAIRT